MNKTSQQFEAIAGICKDIYVKKMKDYGSAWRILRPTSLTDQIFIKAQRIRSIEEKGTHKIAEGIRSEYIGIVNYCVIALIQLELGVSNDADNIDINVASQLFDKYIYKAKSLMEDKNYDYGEAWKDMRIGSITDIILMKLMRAKQIEDNDGKTFISEGVDANYYDMINYSVFALIKLEFA